MVTRLMRTLLFETSPLDGVSFAVQWNDNLPSAGWSAAGVNQIILVDDGITQQVKATLPMGTIAFAAGFASVRRFNAAFRSAYRRPPSAVRGARRPRAARLG